MPGAARPPTLRGSHAAGSHKTVGVVWLWIFCGAAWRAAAPAAVSRSGAQVPLRGAVARRPSRISDHRSRQQATRNLDIEAVDRLTQEIDQRISKLHEARDEDDIRLVKEIAKELAVQERQKQKAIDAAISGLQKEIRQALKKEDYPAVQELGSLCEKLESRRRPAAGARQGGGGRRSRGESEGDPSASCRLEFGLHAARTYREVLDEEPKYCDEVLTKYRENMFQHGPVEPEVERFARWLEQQGFTGYTEERTVQFGEKVGQTWESVLKTDRRYCTWVMKQHFMRGEVRWSDFAHWLRTKLYPDIYNGSCRVGFGENAKMTYREALEKTPEFCEGVVRGVESHKAGNGVPVLMKQVFFFRWLKEQGVEVDKNDISGKDNRCSQAEPPRLIYKHINMEYEDVLQEMPEWCYRLNADSHHEHLGLDCFAGWLWERGDRSSDLDEKRRLCGIRRGSKVLGFGQYKGLSYEEVLSSSPSWCQQIVQKYKRGNSLHPSFKRYALWLIDQDISGDRDKIDGDDDCALRKGVFMG